MVYNLYYNFINYHLFPLSFLCKIDINYNYCIGTFVSLYFVKRIVMTAVMKCPISGLHTNFFACLPFGQVKSSLSDFYLPERKIYLPQNNNT